MALQELEHQLDSDYDNDPRGLLLYWDVISGLHRLLEPAMPISDPNIVIGKVGQQNLLPGHFTLKPKDLEETGITRDDGIFVGNPIPPGISTFLFFGSQGAKQDCLESISWSHLGREPHYKNRLYVSQVGDIRNAGWTAYYAPLINRNCPIYNPLHVIIVPKSIVTASVFTDATQEEKNALTRAFIPWKS